MTGNLTLAIVVGGLFAIGTSLVLQRSFTRVLIGFLMLGHGANLLVLTVAGHAGGAPFTSSTGSGAGTVTPGAGQAGTATPGAGQAGTADPLPQAMALTGIVISMAVTCFLLTLAYRSWQLTGTDEVQDDVEDQRVARDHGEDDPSVDEAGGRGEVDSSELADAARDDLGAHR